MNDMNAKKVTSISNRVFEQMARFECEASAGTHSWVPCGKPATKVIEWRHQVGDREHRLLCDEHVVEQQRFWSKMDWDTSEVSDIEDWNLGVCYGEVTSARVGSRYRDKAA
jgi:hypothetical protein